MDRWWCNTLLLYTGPHEPRQRLGANAALAGASIDPCASHAVLNANLALALARSSCTARLSSAPPDPQLSLLDLGFNPAVSDLSGASPMTSQLCDDMQLIQHTSGAKQSEIILPTIAGSLCY